MYFEFRSFSWQCEAYKFRSSVENPIYQLWALTREGFASHAACGLRPALPSAGSYFLLRHSITNTLGAGILTCCPSPMLVAYGLGPDLP